MKIIGIIPARYNSTRINGKPLIKIAGKTLIETTYLNMLNSGLFEHLYIATDSKLIQKHAKQIDAPCIMTSNTLINGTERCNEVMSKLKIKSSTQDLIINIQCDEPFIKKEHVTRLINLFKEETQIGTIISKINPIDFKDKSVVKLNLATDNTALKFSRNMKDINKDTTIYKHVGIYAYTKETLSALANLPETKAEFEQKLEQLRWLNFNYKIKCAIIKEDLLSINTEQDVKKLHYK